MKLQAHFLVKVLCCLSLFISCSNNGKKIEINAKSDVYIKDDVSKEDAQKLGKFLLGVQYFDEKSDKSVQLAKQADTFVVKFVVNEAKLKENAEAELGFQFMQLWLKDSVFNGRPTKILLTNSDFETIKPINPFKEDEINKGWRPSNIDSTQQ